MQAGAPLPDGIEAMSAEKVRNTRRKVLDGIEFRSTLEANCYRLFRTWESAGAIRNLVCQPKYMIQPKMRFSGRTLRAMYYIADFRFERKIKANVLAAFLRWETVVVDAKGYRMPVYQIKKKLFLPRFPDLVFEEWDRDRLRQNGG